MSPRVAKTGRVNGLSFHRKEPWVLAGLDCGVVELWDYKKLIVIDTFNEHCGPVRGLHFHKSQPLFVSGGDDYKIKVWDYTLRRCLVTLVGHRGCIRSVQFHHEHSWIVSASDDKMVRIWDWQYRFCILKIAVHKHCATYASFHPKEDFIVSTSSDRTFYVWDISALKKKINYSLDDRDFVRYVVRGDKCGYRWASFHPSLPLVVAGADDHSVELWEFGETAAVEGNGPTRQISNISCVLWEKQDIIMSYSEDGSAWVWDATMRTSLQDFSRGYDKFWILAAHPVMSLYAAGHDGGFTIFKLSRERPAFAVSTDSLHYVKDGFYHIFNYSTQKDSQVIKITRPNSGSFYSNHGFKTVSCSPTMNAVLICSAEGIYELLVLPKNSSGWDANVIERRSGSGRSAVFVAPNRFAVLDNNTNQVLVKNIQDKVVKKKDLPIVIDDIFYAGTGNLLCVAEDQVVIFNLQQMLVSVNLETPFVRRVVWSNDMEFVALLSKLSVVIANKKLVHQCTLNERVRVKSGAWHENGVFIYATLDHIKYCLPNGDSGIVRTIDVPSYITKVSNNTIHYLDRQGNNCNLMIDSTEYLFKLAVLKKNDEQVMSMIRGSDLCGQAFVPYLLQKGLPEVALHLVKDERKRFNLALESGNIEIAIASAEEIDEKDQWYRLGVEALRQGYAEVTEYAYLRTKNFSRLSFLYVVTGNLDKLSKMLKIAQVNNDVMGQFHNALYLGDVAERVKILEKAGHLPLAYITTSVHGLDETAECLAAKLGEDVPSLTAVKSRSRSLLVPPTPIMLSGDWPLLRIDEKNVLRRSL